MNAPQLPPRRVLPADVRERMRRRVVGAEEDAQEDTEAGAVARVSGLPGHRTRRWARGPLAAAAGAVLLVGAGVVAVQVFPGPETRTGTPVLPVPGRFAAPFEAEVVPSLPQDLEACGFGGAQAVTVRVPGRRVLITPREQYCELTYTTVVRDDPTDYRDLAVGGSKVLWRSPTGVVLLKPPARTAEMRAWVKEDMPITSKLLDENHFITIPRGRTATVETIAEGAEEPERATLEMDALPNPAPVRDRFPDGSTDPSDPKNTLATCVDAAMRESVDGIDDSGTWESGAAIGTDTSGGLLAMRGPDGADAYCTVDRFRGTHVYAAPDRPGDPSRPLRMVVSKSVEVGSPPQAVLQLAGTVQDDVARLEFLWARLDPQEAVVREGTFAAWLIGKYTTDHVLDDIKVRAYDRNGELLYEGRVM